MINRIATESDWPKLLVFFKRIYREHHPLQNIAFWKWQFGDESYGRSFICVNNNDEVVGHVGANFGGGYAWIINVYLDPEYRGQGVLTELYALARKFYPLAATSANKAGLGLYRNMQWYRYCNLTRYVLINPKYNSSTVEDIITPVNIKHTLKKPEGHFWEQPLLQSNQFQDGTTAVIQENLAGLRAVDICNTDKFVEEAWDAGYRWIDYLSSWNDKQNTVLEKCGWLPDVESIIPWKLNPLIEGKMADISFLSEQAMPKNFVVHRSHSDHGRIGSIQ